MRRATVGPLTMAAPALTLTLTPTRTPSPTLTLIPTLLLTLTLTLTRWAHATTTTLRVAIYPPSAASASDVASDAGAAGARSARPPALSAPQPFYFYIAGLAPTLDFAAPIGLDISAYLTGGGDAGDAGDGGDEGSAPVQWAFGTRPRRPA